MTTRTFQGMTPKIGNNTYVDPCALVVGNVELGDDASVWPMTVIRGDVNSVRVGNRTNIQDGCVLHVTHASSSNPGHALNHYGWRADRIRRCDRRWQLGSARQST